MSDPLADALLLALADQGGPVSVVRLGKRLGQGASAVMRALTLMGDAVLGSQAGPGRVVLQLRDGRWVAQLTEAGRQHMAQVPHD